VLGADVLAAPHHDVFTHCVLRHARWWSWYQGPERHSLSLLPHPYPALPHINAYAAGHDTGMRQLVLCHSKQDCK
jgi:hypothetical protein